MEKFQGLYYSVMSGEDRTAEVVEGNMQYDYTTEIVAVPEKAICNGKTYKVTSIGANAFRRFGCLKSIEIPKTVTEIAGSSFGECRNLDEIKVSERNKDFVSIDGSLYSKDVTSLYCCCPRDITSISIQSPVTTIGEYAFAGCSDLTRVTLGNSVTWIGYNAFYGCSGLEEVYCMMETPIESEEPIFADGALMNAVLYVPKGCKEKYEAVDPWRNFYTIKEFDAVGSSNANVSDEPSVTVEDGTIKVKNIDGQTVSIYDVAGGLVLSVKADGSSIGMVLPDNGVYVVKVNDTETRINL